MAVSQGPVRLVDIDDNNKGLIYEGPWPVYNHPEYQVYGPLFRGSQHQLVNGSGSVSFHFNGTLWPRFLFRGDLLTIETQGQVGSVYMGLLMLVTARAYFTHLITAVWMG